jgi:hypothetical protein
VGASVAEGLKVVYVVIVVVCIVGRVAPIVASVTFALVGGGAIIGGGGGLGCLGEVTSIGNLSFLTMVARPLAITLKTWTC